MRERDGTGGIERVFGPHRWSSPKKVVHRNYLKNKALDHLDHLDHFSARIRAREMIKIATGPVLAGQILAKQVVQVVQVVQP